MENEMGETCSTRGRVRTVYKVLVGKLEGKRRLGGLGLDGRIVVKLILKRTGEDDNGPMQEYLDCLSNC
jgi:hypothetical protein